jgi:hypothetical protein
VSRCKLSGLLGAEWNRTEANRKSDWTGLRTSDQDWLAGLVHELEIEIDEGPKQGSAEKKSSKEPVVLRPRPKAAPSAY